MNCSSSSISSRLEIGRSRAIPAECGDVSISPAHWLLGRRCCFSTSRPPASILGRDSVSGTSSKGWWLRGPTLLLTTQYMEEAERLADQIAVIDRGSVIARGTADQLKARVGV